MTELDDGIMHKLADYERRLERLETQEFLTGNNVTVAARYTRSTVSTFANNTWKIVNYNELVYDTHNAVSTGSDWRFTAPLSGYYHVTAGLLLAFTTTFAENEPVMFAVNRNGAGSGYLDRRQGRDFSGGGEYMYARGSLDLWLDAGDYIQVLFLQWSGGSLNCHTDAAWNQVAIHRLGGTETLQQATVAAHATTAAGQSIANMTHVTVNWDTVVYDTHSAITTGTTWKYTIPVTGYYNIQFFLMFAYSGTWAEHEFVEMRVYINGSSYFILDRPAGRDFSAVSGYMNAGGAGSYYFQAGDVIHLTVYQQSGGTLGLHPDARYNWLSITRYGAVTMVKNEMVAASYEKTSAQTFTHNTFTIIDYETKIYDTHNAVTTGSTWKFTAPRQGYYMITGSLLWTPTTAWAENEYCIIGASLDLNVTQDHFFHRHAGLDSSGVSTYNYMGGSYVHYLEQGATVSIVGYQNTGGSLGIYTASGHYNRVTITKIPAI